MSKYVDTYLQEHLRPLYRRSDEGGGYSREETRGRELRYRQLAACTIGGELLNEQLGHIICLLRRSFSIIARENEYVRTQKDTAKIGVTPSNGGTTPR